MSINISIRTTNSKVAKWSPFKYGKVYTAMQRHIEDEETGSLVVSFDSKANARKFQVAMRTNSTRPYDTGSLCSSFLVAVRGCDAWLTLKE